MPSLSCHVHLLQHDTERTISICVALPEVAKASKAVVQINDGFANKLVNINKSLCGNARMVLSTHFQPGANVIKPGRVDRTS
jgi:hypothetical protein